MLGLLAAEPSHLRGLEHQATGQHREVELVIRRRVPQLAHLRALHAWGCSLLSQSWDRAAGALQPVEEGVQGRQALACHAGYGEEGDHRLGQPVAALHSSPCSVPDSVDLDGQCTGLQCNGMRSYACELVCEAQHDISDQFGSL